MTRRMTHQQADAAIRKIHRRAGREGTAGRTVEQQSQLRKSHIFPREENEHYVEPSWVDRRLFETEQFQGAIVDPACGWGTIVIEARRAGHCAAGFDLVDRGWDSTRTPLDFFTVNERFDNIVTNPPFACVPEFITHAVECTRYKVAAIFPFARLVAARAWLDRLPLARVLMLTPRPSMPPGRYIKAGGKVGQGRRDFCWLIFEHGSSGAAEFVSGFIATIFRRIILTRALAVHITQMRRAIWAAAKYSRMKHLHPGACPEVIEIKRAPDVSPALVRDREVRLIGRAP